MNLIVNSRIVIPTSEIQWRFSRSSGSGGQNVNKVDSKVGIIFDIKKSRVFTPAEKFRIQQQLKGKIINFRICLVVQETRSQYLNRQLALSRLAELLREGLKPMSKSRKVTKPTKAAHKRRIDYKKKRGELKKRRQKHITTQEI